MCPVLFKASRSPLSSALVLRSLLYVMSLSCKAIHSALLAVLCCTCGYGIVCLFFYAGVSLFTINGLYVFMVVCVVYAYNLAWGCLKNGKNGGEPNGFCLVFVFLEKVAMGVLWKSTFKVDFVSGDFL